MVACHLTLNVMVIIKNAFIRVVFPMIYADVLQWGTVCLQESCRANIAGIVTKQEEWFKIRLPLLPKQS